MLALACSWILPRLPPGSSTLNILETPVLVFLEASCAARVMPQVSSHVPLLFHFSHTSHTHKKIWEVWNKIMLPLEGKLPCSYKFLIFIIFMHLHPCVHYVPVLCPSQFIFSPLKRQTFGGKSNVNTERILGSNWHDIYRLSLHKLKSCILVFFFFFSLRTLSKLHTHTVKKMGLCSSSKGQNKSKLGSLRKGL